MNYKPMTDEQLDKAVDSAIDSALNSLYLGIDNNVPSDLLSRIEDAVCDWEGWQDYILERDYDMFLDTIDSNRDSY